MALGNVFMQDTDGNIGQDVTSVAERICGLIFDISEQESFWESGAGAELAETLKDKIIEINSMEDVDTLGITPYSGESDFLAGIPYYHLKHFFARTGGTGRLFLAFADCKANFNIITDMQKAANGMISQIGVWTEQCLWEDTDVEEASQPYVIRLISDLQGIAQGLADSYNAPLHIILSANSAKTKTADGNGDKIVWSRIPTCVIDARYLSVVLSQSATSDVAKMQTSLTSCTPVGTIGGLLGCLATASVAESIGWVQEFDVAGLYGDIEFGFGDATVSEDKLTNSTRYDSLSIQQLNALEELGYIFLCKYAGLEGHTYFSGDTACSDGDYRTIARNRTINKSRRLVRAVLLPYVNAPIKVDPATGFLSAAQNTVFQNLINGALQAMQDAEEISGFSATIPQNQNILKNDTLRIEYKLVPVGTSKSIRVTEGLSITTA